MFGTTEWNLMHDHFYIIFPFCLIQSRITAARIWHFDALYLLCFTVSISLYRTIVGSISCGGLVWRAKDSFISIQP